MGGRLIGTLSLQLNCKVSGWAPRLPAPPPILSLFLHTYLSYLTFPTSNNKCTAISYKCHAPTPTHTPKKEAVLRHQFCI